MVGLLKGAADLVYTFRFIRMMVMKWESWDAYKEGVIDKNGKRIKSVKLDSDAKRSSWTPFVRLCANIKRLVQKIPGGGSKLGSFASALYLIKENGNLTDKNLKSILEKTDITTMDFLSEASDWFILEDGQLSPGVYRVNDYKIVNSSFEEIVFPKDKIRVAEDCYPLDNVFGLNIYKATHLKTNQPIYITSTEIKR